MAKGMLDLEKHFAKYGAYHSNPINIFLHTLFVWPIFFTALLLSYFTTPLLSLPPALAALLPFSLGQVLRLNSGFVSAVLYAVFYVSLDAFAGCIGALLCLACWVGSSVVANNLGYDLAWKVGVGAQVFCWSAQFIGHGIFEKRAPALLDNLFQAFLMAPFFVLLEVLQKAFGYEPYAGFNARVHAKIEADIKGWKASKQKSI